eukprot:scaffold21404_cov32-Tisochrysis_lutea.AAC.5
MLCLRSQPAAVRRHARSRRKRAQARRGVMRHAEQRGAAAATDVARGQRASPRRAAHTTPAAQSGGGGVGGTHRAARARPRAAGGRPVGAASCELILPKRRAPRP